MGAALQQYSPIDAGTSSRRSATADGITVAELRFAPGARLQRHAHELATITVTLEGSFETVLDSRIIHNPLHGVLAKPAGEAHGNTFGSAGARLLMISIDENGDEFFACRKALRMLPNAVDVRAGGLATALSAELAEPDDLTPLSLAGLARELVARASRLPAPRHDGPPQWLRNALEYVETNLDCAVGLRRVANVSGVHPVHFARAFRAHTGQSLGTFVRARRLQRAAAMLGSSEQPIASVALALGFSDQSHMTRLFRASTGYTPAAYRRMMRSR